MELAEAAVCSQQHGATFATVVFFLQKKLRLLISKTKRKSYEKDIPLKLNSTGILLLLQELNSERYIYFFFFIFKTLAGRCPPAAVHLQDALTSKKRDTSLLFSSGHVCHRSEDYKKKKWNLIPLRRAYEWPKESARTNT